MPKYSGETIDQAIESGLKSLNISKEQANIEIVEEGKRGFLGFGKRLAEVSITAKEQPKEVQTSNESQEQVTPTKTAETIEEPKAVVEAKGDNKNTEKTDLSDDEAIEQLAIYLTEVTKELNAPALVKVKRQDQFITFNLETDKKGLLIGKHGKILNALQYLAQVYIHRIAKNRLSVMVNVGDYRERREEILRRLAKRTAREVRETGQAVFLEPMPAFERKQVHAILAEEEDISTHSEGNEPHRYLVVELK